MISFECETIHNDCAQRLQWSSTLWSYQVEKIKKHIYIYICTQRPINPEIYDWILHIQESKILQVRRQK